MTNISVRILAWLLFAALVVVTLGPIGLRPTTGYPVQIERGVAFFVIGFVFVVAYPRHVFGVALFVLLGAVALEFLQNLNPDRHGREIDALAKVVGALLGIAVGLAAAKLAMRGGWGRSRG